MQIRYLKKLNGSCLKQDKATFTPLNKVHLFIVYELDTWSKDLNTNFILKSNSLKLKLNFYSKTLTKNADPDKYSYFGFGIGFDSHSPFLHQNFDWSKNVTIFRVDNNSSVHTNNEKKDILALGEIPGLDDTFITTKAKYSINFFKKLFKSAL